MKEERSARPAIVVDLKKNRIRIHKTTLHAIGAPEYVLLLVNPEEGTLAVSCADRGDPRAHHIPMQTSPGKNAFELYSKSLVGKLHDVCDNWKSDLSYRLYGQIIPEEDAAYFAMLDAVPTKEVG